jgi:Domain of unknown function (DUF4386)
MMRARLAGGLYFLSVASALANEAFVHGGLLYVVSVVPIVSFLAATLLIYGIFKCVNGNVALIAAASNIVSLGFEAIEVHPGGVNAGLLFHGLYCVVIGYLAFESGFVPRILGALMMTAGLAWLTSVSPSVALHLSPYDTAVGFIGEVSLMLWLLVKGVATQPTQSRGKPT